MLMVAIVVPALVNSRVFLFLAAIFRGIKIVIKKLLNVVAKPNQNRLIFIYTVRLVGG